MNTRDIERAAETLCAMAAIPCLQGGYVPLDFTKGGLEPEGWQEHYHDRLRKRVYPFVPGASASLADCRAIIEGALAEDRAEFERQVASDVPTNIPPDIQAELLSGRAETRRLLELIDPEHEELDPDVALAEAFGRMERVVLALGGNPEGLGAMRANLVDDEAGIAWARLITDEELASWLTLRMEAAKAAA